MSAAISSTPDHASCPQTPRLAPASRTAARPWPRSAAAAYFAATALFCLQMGFTAYAQFRLPQVAAAFEHLGFPAWFRLELGWAKLLGVLVLLSPAPVRLKEWAWAGFAIDLGSALVAHFAAGDGPQAWGWAAATGALGALAYLAWRLRIAALARP
jgi:DoxX-like family